MFVDKILQHYADIDQLWTTLIAKWNVEPTQQEQIEQKISTCFVSTIATLISKQHLWAMLIAKQEEKHSKNFFHSICENNITALLIK
jgi:hypothetical protein